MFKCKDCGAEYNKNFLQCPQCGSSRRADVEEANSHINDGIVGTLMSLLIVLGLCGLIGYGVYLYLHPFEEGPAMSDLDESEFTTTTSLPISKSSEEISTTTAKGNYVPRSTTTTSKLTGSERTFGGHTYIVPDGYIPAVQFKQTYDIGIISSVTYDCIMKNDDPSVVYCLSINDGYYVTINGTNQDALNELSKQQGYTEWINKRLYGRSMYYVTDTKSPEGMIRGALGTNKNQTAVLMTFSMYGNELNEETGLLLTQIINSIK